MARTATVAGGGQTAKGRAKLKAGRKLHVVGVVTDRLHLCYRRREVAKGEQDVNGTWVLRRFDPTSTKFPYTVETIGTADDLEQADGVHCLTYHQAMVKAQGMTDAPTRAQVIADTATVRDVLIEYVAMHDARHKDRRGRAVRSDASQRVHRYLLGQPAKGRQKETSPAAMAGMQISSLSEADLRRWRSSLPKDLKAATVTRLCSDLRAALLGWYSDNRDHADPRFAEMVRYGLKPPKQQVQTDPSVRDDQILTDEQVRRVVQAASETDEDTHRLVMVMAATGSRFSQIARLRVRDFQPVAERLMMPVSRKGRGSKAKTHTPVPIGPEVVALLLPVHTGRNPGDFLLEHRLMQQTGPASWDEVGRKPWEASSEFARHWRTIRDQAEIPSAIPYSLRHSSIVRGLRAGLPIRLVAALHDTSVAVIEKHYAAHIADGLEDMARAAIVPLSTRKDNVVPIRGQA